MARLHELCGDKFVSAGPPLALGLFRSVALVVCLKRKNVTQDFAGAVFGVSQATRQSPLGPAAAAERSPRGYVPAKRRAASCTSSRTTRAGNGAPLPAATEPAPPATTTATDPQRPPIHRTADRRVRGSLTGTDSPRASCACPAHCQSGLLEVSRVVWACR